MLVDWPKKKRWDTCSLLNIVHFFPYLVFTFRKTQCSTIQVYNVLPNMRRGSNNMGQKLRCISNLNELATWHPVWVFISLVHLSITVRLWSNLHYWSLVWFRKVEKTIHSLDTIVHMKESALTYQLFQAHLCRPRRRVCPVFQFFLL